MKVLFVNTSEHIGGAAIAAKRIMAALRKQHLKTKMLVLHRNSSCAYVVEKSPMIGFCKPLIDQIYFLWDRLVIFLANRCHKAHLFEVDAAVAGYDITTAPDFNQADIIHLHWVNQGFMSMRSLERLAASGKPVVWTLHDMWPVTGICHYARACEHFHTQCHHCPLLYQGHQHDLSTCVFLRKQRLYKHVPNWYFVTCSEWLQREVEKSALWGNNPHLTTIPNALDTTKYQCPNSQVERDAIKENLNLPKDKTILLFVAYRVTDEKKGYNYLVDSLNRLVQQQLELRQQLVLVAAGKEAEKLQEVSPIEVFDMGYVSDAEKMLQLYCAADLLLMPSLQDNLPNTIAEAMACNTPCVAFRVGGIPEMIDHQHNGYLAQYCDAVDFAAGVLWCLQHNADGELSAAAREKAITAYSECVVANKYKKIYEEVLETGIEPVQPSLAKGF